MTRDDIIRMAAESGMPVDIGSVIASYADLKRFAAKVAAAEREECAKLIESLKEVRGKGWVSFPAWDIQKAMADIIRARGNQ